MYKSVFIYNSMYKLSINMNPRTLSSDKSTRSGRREYKGNKLFREDIKEFYKILGAYNIDVREPACVAEIEPNWKSPWEEVHSVMKKQFGYDLKREG